MIDLYDYYRFDKNTTPIRELSAHDKLIQLFRRNKFRAKANLYCYHTENTQEKKPAMLIFPGGGYEMTSTLEWENIADAYAEQGFRTFALDYSVHCFRFPTQLNEGLMAMAYLREHADELGVADKIAVCGFSAGGHLAGSVSTLFDCKEVYPDLKKRGVALRPDASVLCYPVITGDRSLCHQGSFNALCGARRYDLQDRLSLEKCVSSDAPPAFLWHTIEDNAVSYRNSVLYEQAMKDNNRPVKLCLYQKGRHGLNLAKGYEAEAWFGESVDFLRNVVRIFD